MFINRIIAFFFFVSMIACKSGKEYSVENTIYKIGYKTASSSTGSLSNSAFVLKINEGSPSLLVTAHHTVAGIGNDRYLKWNEIEKNQKNAWAWSMHDSSYSFKVGRNLPIRNAETLKFDVAAFYLPSADVPHLIPAKRNVEIGDTVYLFSKIIYNNEITIVNPAIVIYASDSVLVYELTLFNMARVMNGTSGSAVINKNNEVVSNHYGGFTIPNAEVKKEIATRFPLLNTLETRNGKSYGIGHPIGLIEKSIMQAFAEDQAK